MKSMSLARKVSSSCTISDVERQTQSVYGRQNLINVITMIQELKTSNRITWIPVPCREQLWRTDS